MKIHHYIIAAFIFLICFFVLGFRGLDAGFVGAGVYMLGVHFGHKESEVADFFAKLKAKYIG